MRRKKTINKSYNVTSEDKLEIENQFGNVSIATWDKDEITVDVEISAKAATEQKVEDIMNEIEVKELRSEHIINFKTKVGSIHSDKSDKRDRGDEERTFYIDYVVHMPAANRLQIENSFGKVSVPSIKGEVNLTSKFGSLEAGTLDNVDAIDVEFGKCSIGQVNDGKIIFKFNKESNIGQVNGSVTITSEFSHNVQFNVGDNIKDLSVFESYSGVQMIVAKSLSARIDVHTSFGKFRNESEFAIHERRDDESDYGPHFDKDYHGEAGDGKARIKIKSNFGNVRFAHTAHAFTKDPKDKKDKADKKDKDDDDNDSDNDNDKDEKTT